MQFEESCCQLRLVNNEAVVQLGEAEFSFVHNLYLSRSEHLHFDSEKWQSQLGVQKVVDLVNDLLSSGYLETKEPFIFEPYIIGRTSSEGEKTHVFFPESGIILLTTPKVLKSIDSICSHRWPSELHINANHLSLLKKSKILNRPYIKTSVEIEKSLKRLVLLPTTGCNLQCVYCYSYSPDKRHKTLELNIATAAISDLLQRSRAGNNQSASFGLLGGGEPLLPFDLVKKIVEYSYENAKRNKIDIDWSVTTNGYHSEEIADWVGENFNTIKISFEGNERIQNLQRKAKNNDSYLKVLAFAKRLASLDKKPMILSTVTSEGASFIDEIKCNLDKNLSDYSLILNTVNLCGACEANNQLLPSLDAFFESLKNTIIKTKEFANINIAYDTVLNPPADENICGFRRGNYYLTPDGYFSACPEVDTADHPLARLFFFGKWNQEKEIFEINIEKFNQIHLLMQTASTRHCGGQNCKLISICPGACFIRMISDEIVNYLKVGPVESDLSKEELDHFFACGKNTDIENKCTFVIHLFDGYLSFFLDNAKLCEEKKILEILFDSPDFLAVELLR